MEQEKKFAELQLEEVEGKKVFVATDETIDREGEVLSIDGWNLANFKRNPIILWSHNPFEPLIGKAENIRYRLIEGKKKLTFEPVFHKLNEMSTLVSDLVEKGWMKTVSVGFRPFKKDGNKFTQQELLEISFVNIPANPEATTLALSKGLKQETVDKLFGNETEPEPIEEEKAVEATESKQDEQITQMMDQISELNKKIKNLEVAASSAKPVESLESRPGQGRQPSERKALNVALIREANKALSTYLRLVKEKS